MPTIRHFITHFFDKNTVTTYLHSFLKNDAKFDDFVTYITDYMHIKTSYFDAMKKYMTHMFQKKDAYNPANAEEMDERMSAIGE
ncbi:hypothetical protein KA478_04710 [Patescibacteria group bacterium]|nr:hypothetical protein [Patescibacteria group bacterium]